MKKTIGYIALIILCSVFIIYKFKPNSSAEESNGFNRKLVNHKIKLVNVISLPDEYFDFAGRLDKNIILSSYSKKLTLYKVNQVDKKLDTINLRYHPDFNTSTNIYRDVELPNIYSSNPFGDISIYNGTIPKHNKLTGLRIDNFLVVSPQTIIARARHYYGQEINRALTKLKLSDNVIIEKKYPLPEQTNGFFTNDGWLIYDKSYSKIIYTYYYRGEFLTLDTNLNLKYIGKTIDTIHKSKINIGIIKSKSTDGQILSEITPIKPPKFVNRYATTNEGHIYILSALKADNETKSQFIENQVIDVYDINKGKYLYSFYIPKYKKQKLHQFQIKDKTLMAIFGPYLVSYNFLE